MCKTALLTQATETASKVPTQLFGGCRCVFALNLIRLRIPVDILLTRPIFLLIVPITVTMTIPSPITITFMITAVAIATVFAAMLALSFAFAVTVALASAVALQISSAISITLAFAVTLPRTLSITLPITLAATFASTLALAHRLAISRTLSISFVSKLMASLPIAIVQFALLLTCMGAFAAMFALMLWVAAICARIKPQAIRIAFAATVTITGPAVTARSFSLTLLGPHLC